MSSAGPYAGGRCRQRAGKNAGRKKKAPCAGKEAKGYEG